MDPDPALFDFYAHVGRRRWRRQGRYPEATTDALDSIESAGFADHEFHLRLERWPRGGRPR